MRRPRLATTAMAVLVLLAAAAAAPAAAALPTVPSAEAALTGVRTVNAGDFHTCALLTSTEVRCWGANGYGQLGDGSLTGRVRPVAVSNANGSARLTTVAQITSGGFHTCARLTNGLAACWGRNNRGQLGDGTTTNRRRPILVSNPAGTGWLTGVTDLSTGDQHTCARLQSGHVVCWGDNSSGQLGNATTTSSRRPVTTLLGTAALGGITQVNAGALHTCARSATGRAYCWGSNSSGQLGSGANDLDSDMLWYDHHSAVSVHDGRDPLDILHHVRAVSAGGTHSCALTTDGKARCWGSNISGELGDGLPLPVPPDDPPDNRPTSVAWPAGLTIGVAGVAAGGLHSCAITTVGVACRGSNWRGRLGNGTTTDSLTPVAVG